MIYLIGGAPRTGKSIFTQKILERNKIPYISTDIVLHMLKHAAPQLGVTDEIPHVERAEKFYPFFKQFVRLTQNCLKDYLIEGDCFLPKQVRELSKEFEIKACFFGFSQITLESVQKYKSSNDWIGKLSKEELNKLPQWIVDLSNLFKEECKKYGFPYFDLSQNYNEKLEEAYFHLFPKRNTA